MISFKKSAFHITFIYMLCCSFSASGQPVDDYSKPIDITQSIAELQSSLTNSCYLGLGSQQTKLKIDNQDVDNSTSNSLSDFSSVPSLLFGCFFNSWEVGLGINHDSYELDTQILFQGKTFNNITYYQNTVSVGYLAHLWLNHFYLTTGILYSNTRYQLEYYNATTEEEYSSEIKNDNQFMYYINFVTILTPSLFINLKHQRSFSDKHFIQEQSQIVFNYYTSF